MAEEKILTENELDGVSGGAVKIRVANKQNVLPRKDDVYYGGAVKSADAAVTTAGSSYTAKATVLSDGTLGSVTGGSVTPTVTRGILNPNYT